MVDLEDAIVTELGHRIGFGRVMQAAEAAWKRVAVERGTAGSEHTVGPCAALLVSCPHLDPEPPAACFDKHGHCDWCCGARRVTERVARAIRECK